MLVAGGERNARRPTIRASRHHSHMLSCVCRRPDGGAASIGAGLSSAGRLNVGAREISIIAALAMEAEA